MTTTRNEKPDTPASREVFVQMLRSWLAENPGWHAPVDIAKSMGVPTHTAAARCLYLADRGLVLRRQRKVGKAKKSMYADPSVTPPE